MIDDAEGRHELTEAEVELQKEELALKRRQMTLNFRKAIFVSGIISAAVGLTTAVLNFEMSGRELKLSQQQDENSHLAKFVDHALLEDQQKRLLFAQYFATLTPEGEARGR